MKTLKMCTIINIAIWSYLPTTFAYNSTTNDTIRFLNTVKIGELFNLYQTNFQEFESDLVLYLQTSKKNNFKKGISKVLLCQADLEQTKGNFKQAFKLANDALLNVEDSTSKSIRAMSYRCMANTIIKHPHFDYKKDSLQLRNLYNLLIVNLDPKMPPNDLCFYYLFGAFILVEIKDYNTCINLLSKTRSFRIKNNAFLYFDGFISNLEGRVFLEKGNIQKSEKSLYNSIKIGKKLNNNKILELAYFHVGHLYLKKKNLIKAKEYFFKSLHISTWNNSVEIYEGLSQIYFKEKKYKQAYYYLSKTIQIKDSISKKINIIELDYLNQQIQSTEQSKKIIEITSKNERLKLTQNIYITISFFLIVLTIVLLLFSLKIKFLNNKLVKTDNIKDTLFSFIAHDLREPSTSLFKLSKLTELYVLNKEYDKVISLSKKLEKVSQNINFIIDNLMKWSLLQQNKIRIRNSNFQILPMIMDFKEEFKSIIVEKNISLNINIEEDIELFTDRTAVFLILRNLLSNAFKFSSENGQVDIIVHKESSTTEIIIQDYGIGFKTQSHPFILKKQSILSNIELNDDIVKTGGIGMALCYKLAILCGIDMEHQSDVGIGTRVRLKVTKQFNYEYAQNSERISPAN